MSAFCGISLALIAGMARVKSPLTLVYPAAFIAFVVWKYLGGGFDLTMSAILIAGSILATLNPQPRVTLNEMADTFETGVKYQLIHAVVLLFLGFHFEFIDFTERMIGEVERDDHQRSQERKYSG